MFTILNDTTDLTHDPRKLNLNGTPSNLQLKPQAEITWITARMIHTSYKLYHRIYWTHSSKFINHFIGYSRRINRSISFQ